MHNTPFLINVSQFKTSSTSVHRAFNLCFLDKNPEKKLWFHDKNDIVEMNYFYRTGDFEKLLLNASRFNTIKDFPWNISVVPKMLLGYYPNSIFVLVERDPEIWYNSLYNWCNSVPTDMFLRNKPDEIKKFISNGKIIPEKFYNGSLENKDKTIEEYIKRNIELKEIFKNSKNFYVLKMPDDLNWKKIMEVADVQEDILKNNILKWQNDNTNKLNIKYIENENDSIDKWIFPYIHKLEKENNFIEIEGVKIYKRHY
jgi:hypothetical protein